MTVHLELYKNFKITKFLLQKWWKTKQKKTSRWSGAGCRWGEGVRFFAIKMLDFESSLSISTELSKLSVLAVKSKKKKNWFNFYNWSSILKERDGSQQVEWASVQTSYLISELDTEVAEFVCIDEWDASDTTSFLASEESSFPVSALVIFSCNLMAHCLCKKGII